MTYSEEPAQYNVHSAINEEYCLETEWRELKRGKPVDEMFEGMKVGK